VEHAVAEIKLLKYAGPKCIKERPFDVTLLYGKSIMQLAAGISSFDVSRENWYWESFIGKSV
jgi:hypothetical protein